MTICYHTYSIFPNTALLISSILTFPCPADDGKSGRGFTKSEALTLFSITLKRQTLSFAINLSRTDEPPETQKPYFSYAKPMFLIRFDFFTGITFFTKVIFDDKVRVFQSETTWKIRVSLSSLRSLKSLRSLISPLSSLLVRLLR